MANETARGPARPGDHITLGRASYINEPYVIFEGGRVRVGNYTSIAPNCTFLAGRSNHPTALNRRAVSNFHFGEPARAEDVIIGSDVWIGVNATIMGGVTIGDGAIVGACALVTADVPPFMVVGGVGARSLYPRFPAATVRRLLTLGWWHWPEAKVEEARGLFGDVAAFLARYDAEGGAA